MKLVILQKNINNPDYLGFIEDIAGLSPDLVCLGELGTTGCLYNGGEPVSVDSLKAELSQFQFGIMLGLPRMENGQLLNSYGYFKDGQDQFYDKINLFKPMNETNVFQAGTGIGLFDTEFGKIGVAICYDIRFPELFQQLKEAGAKMIFVPAAFPRVRIHVWRDLLKERALETGLTIVAINAVGDDGTNEFGGTSMVIDGQGKTIAQADEINELFIEVEL